MDRTSLSSNMPELRFRQFIATSLLVLACLALAAYLWPVIHGPLLMDEVYGVISTRGFDASDSFFTILTVPFSEEILRYFLYEQGRIGPFGNILYYGGYWLTTKTALATGIPIAVTYSLFKLLFIYLAFVGLRLLIILFAEHKGKIDKHQKRMVTWITILAAFVFISGLKTDYANRNGFTVYPFLTYTALLYALLIPVVLISIRRSPKMSSTFPLLSMLFGLVIAFGYELHYGAVITTTIALFATRLQRKIISIDSLKDLLLLISFSIAYVFKQILIVQACSTNECYSGTSIKLNRDLPVFIVNNLKGNLPSRSNSTYILQREFGIDIMPPTLFSFWDVIPVLFVSTLLAATFFTVRKLTSHKVPLIITDEIKGAAIKGIVVFIGLALFTIFTTSLSELAQELLVDAVPYRGYVVIWFSISVAFTLLIFWLLERFMLASASCLIFAFIIGWYLHPWSVFGVQIAKNIPGNDSFQKVISSFESKPGSDNTEPDRCRILGELGESRRAKAVQTNINGVYENLYGVKFCNKQPLSLVD
jgi:hypothetical protein